MIRPRPSHHPGHNLPAAQKWTAHVGFEAAPPVVRIGFPRLPERTARAGIVDQHGDRAEPLTRILSDAPDRAWIANVGRQRDRGSTAGFDQTHGFGNLTGGAGHRHHAHARRGQTDRECLPQSAPSSGDQRYSAFQIFVDHAESVYAGSMRISVAALLTSALLLPCAHGAKKPDANGDYFVYIGTYTREDSKGIYAYRFHPADGKLTPIGLAAETTNPSFLAIHPSGRFVYSVSEVDSSGGENAGAVSAFRIDPQSGKLTLLNTVSSKGAGPCHVLVDKTGKNLLVANYSSGSVASLPLKSDGSLSEASAFIQHKGSSVDPQRQQGPHAHSVNLSADNRFMIATDLGLDQALVYRFDAAKGLLTPNDPPFAKLNPGAGPRHFAFHPKGNYAYVINEIQSSVTAFHYDRARGAFHELQTVSTLPKDFSGRNSTAEVEVDRNGKFLYGSNRGQDTIAVFAIDSRKGTLTPVENTPTQGKTPRNFAIDPTGRYLFAANQGSGSVVLFRIDQKTGHLTPAGQKLDVPLPVCVTFVAVR
jgi:6-phosphogluconolactonase